MAIEITEYKTGYSSPLLGEWVEVCKSELGTDGKSLKFTRMGYPHSSTFQEKHGLQTESTYDRTSQLQVIKMSVSEDFPYFIIQIRHILTNYEPVIWAYAQLKDYLLYDETETKPDINPPLVNTPKTEIVLFQPGQGTSNVGISIDCPELNFPFVINNEYLERIERDYEELRKLCLAQALKSIYVLTGSIIESIIEDALLQESASAISNYKKFYKKDRTDFSENIKKWYFDRKIWVANGIDLISNQLKMQLLDIKEHRNVVHIGFEIDNKIKVDLSFVNTILSILKNLCEHLEHPLIEPEAN